MFTENEKKLIHALIDAGLEEMALGIPVGLNDEQMLILAEYIYEKLSAGEKVTRNDVGLARLYLLGKIEFEEDD